MSTRRSAAAVAGSMVVALVVAAPQASHAEDATVYLGDRIEPGVTQNNAMFGNAVAVSGDYAVVGAVGWDGVRANTGRVFVYQRAQGAWQQDAVLDPPSAAPADEEFGNAVAISGETIAVGVHLSDVPFNSGRVHVFERQGGEWVLTGILAAPDLQAADQFGDAIAIDGDHIAVGAMYDDTGAGMSAGSVYIYERTEGTWSFHSKLSSPEAEADDRFGNSVALDGGVLVVGARGNDEPSDATSGIDAGAAYVFERTGAAWEFQEKLSSPLLRPGYRFGRSVAIEGPTIAVGADGDDHDATDSGAVYLYDVTESGWTEAQRVTASDALGGERFGGSVAIDGGLLIAGTRPRFLDASPPSRGAAYVFEFDGAGWTQRARLEASTVGDDFFGNSLSADAGSIIVGAPLVADSAGTAFVFRTGISGRVTYAVGDGLTTPACVSVYDGSLAEIASAQTDIGGNYEIGLDIGTYLVGFTDCGNGIYAEQWYDDQPSPITATAVSVRLGVRTDVDAELAAAVTCNGLAPTHLGTPGDDVIVGTSGDDVIMALGGADEVRGLEGNDTICGGEGNDLLFGGAGNDTILANQGRDKVVGGPGDDDLRGGYGIDTVSYATAGAAVSVDLALGTAVGAGSDTLAGFVNVIGSSHDDTIEGNSRDNELEGRRGNDTLQGRKGRDRLWGHAGDDHLRGGAWADTLIGGKGADTIEGGWSLDTLIGNDGDDLLLGQQGNDVISGNAGNDTLDGGSDIDNLDGGEGIDLCRSGETSISCETIE